MTHIAKALNLALQCGRIYKDAEIGARLNGPRNNANGFNVAASIKMRKSFRTCIRRVFDVRLQCGRIYKDAEILECATRAAASYLASMWPHL